VLVSGAAGGIGREVSRQFLVRGNRVICFDVDADALHATADELAACAVSPAAIITSVGDTSCWEDVEAAVTSAVSGFGGLDIVVASAGVVGSASIMELDTAEWERVLSINLTGVFFLVRAASRVMAAQGSGGAIVAVASTNGFWVEPNSAHYNTSKGALIAFVRSAAIELARDGIRVNAVAPGVVRTQLTQKLTHDQALAVEYRSRIPLGRFGEPSDIANSIAFLASDESSWITGQTVVVDGGQTLGRVMSTRN
jgi:meso-butanediol dehydrogenase / (S,S)-butanediol dehydrogenase / diacetyl reductase